MADDIQKILDASKPEERMSMNPNPPAPEPEIVNVNEQKTMADNIANMDLIREATQKGIDVPTLLAQKEAEGAQIAQHPASIDTVRELTQRQSFPEPQVAIEPQVQVQQPKPQVTVMPEASIAPNPVIVADKVARRKTQLEDQIAEEVAQESTTKDIENQLQEETQSALDKVDSEIKGIGAQQLSDYFNQGTVWQKVLAGISLGMGGFYAGYTGRENPALQILTREVEGNRELRKLKQDERNKIIAAQSDLLAQRLKAWEADPNRSPIARLKAEEARLNLEKTSSEIRKNLADVELIRAKSRAEGSPVKVGTLSNSVNDIPESQRENAVVLPDGRVGIAISKKQAEEFNKYQAEVAPALEGIDRIDGLVKDFNRATDLTKRGQIQSELMALTGQLRLSFLGPGAMTEKEYDRLKDAVGDPTKLAAFPTVQRARLNQVKKKLRSDYNTRLKQAGISVPSNKPTFSPDQEQRIDALTKATLDKAKREGKALPSSEAVRKAYERYFNSQQE